jgi:hypothetical protein
MPACDGIQAVMRAVLAWEPDVVFLISDAGFGRNLPTPSAKIDLAELGKEMENLRRQYGKLPRIHFIGFQVPRERATSMRALVSRTGGHLRTIDAPSSHESN